MYPQGAPDVTPTDADPAFVAARDYARTIGNMIAGSIGHYKHCRIVLAWDKRDEQWVWLLCVTPPNVPKDSPLFATTAVVISAEDEGRFIPAEAEPAGTIEKPFDPEPGLH